MDKKKLEKLKTAIDGGDVPLEFKLVLDKEEILKALSGVLKEISDNNDGHNKNLVARVDEAIKTISGLNSEKQIKNILADLQGIGALLVSIKEKEPLKEFSINNLDVLLNKIDELKQKPSWYKEFTFNFAELFKGFIDIVDAYWKKIWQVEVTNKKPIQVWIVDKNGNVIERFGSRQNVMGSPVDSTQNVNIVGGLTDTSTPYKNLDVDESGDLVITGAKKICSYFIINLATATRYVKFYNKATAPTVGTDTPVITIPLSAGAAANLDFDEAHLWPFSLGIGIGATTGVADNNTGAPGANEVVVNIWYK